MLRDGLSGGRVEDWHTGSMTATDTVLQAFLGSLDLSDAHRPRTYRRKRSLASARHRAGPGVSC
jgi:hypothetical protein